MKALIKRYLDKLFRRNSPRKQFNVEIIKKARIYWHKIVKFFVLVTFAVNGLCALFNYWSFMFLYFSTFVVFSVIFILFMFFYRPEINIKEEM